MFAFKSLTPVSKRKNEWEKEISFSRESEGSKWARIKDVA